MASELGALISHVAFQTKHTTDQFKYKLEQIKTYANICARHKAPLRKKKKKTQKTFKKLYNIETIRPFLEEQIDFFGFLYTKLEMAYGLH